MSKHNQVGENNKGWFKFIGHVIQSNTEKLSQNLPPPPPPQKKSCINKASEYGTELWKLWKWKYSWTPSIHYTKHTILITLFFWHILLKPMPPWLTFKRPGWYVNFSAWFMINILFEQKKIKLWNKWHFVQNKRDYAAYLKNAVNVLVV
jgi:hypothetical protein